MNIGERIKKVRKENTLTQQEFSKKVNVKRNTVALYEADKITPSPAVIALICREFDINEEWLRTGEGEMFAAQETLALDDPTLDDLDRAILQSYIKMPPARRAFFKEWVKEMIAVFSQTDAQKEKAAPEISEAEYEKAQAIVDAYRAQKNEYVKKGWPTSTPEEDEAG